MPKLTRDLLLLDGSTLRRWNHLIGQIEYLVGPADGGGPSLIQEVSFDTKGPTPLPGSVVQYSVSADGRQVALVRVTGFNATGPTREIALLDVETLRTKSLVPLEADVLDISLSPNGEWVTYILQGAQLSAVPTRTPKMAALAERSPAGGGPGSGAIYAIRTNAPDERIEVGFCAEINADEFTWGCGGRGRLLWLPDGGALLWNDAHGVWLGGLGQAPRLLAANRSGGASRNRAYTPWAWSPSGLYVLTWISYYEGGSQAVMNIQTGQVIDVPDTSEYPEPVARIAWLQDERLFLLRRNGTVGMDNFRLSGEIWRITASGTLRRDREVALPIDTSGFAFFTAPTTLEDGRAAFGILNIDNANYEARGLYTIAPDNLTVHRLTGLPPGMTFTAQTIWSPDGTGAIVTDLWSSDQLLYAPADGSALYDLRPVLGENVCCFTWLK